VTGCWLIPGFRGGQAGAAWKWVVGFLGWRAQNERQLNPGISQSPACRKISPTKSTGFPRFLCGFIAFLGVFGDESSKTQKELLKQIASKGLIKNFGRFSARGVRKHHQNKHRKGSSLVLFCL
jgi:hypothetical protein